jgi:hypothetical protein
MARYGKTAGKSVKSAMHPLTVTSMRRLTARTSEHRPGCMGPDGISPLAVLHPNVSRSMGSNT